MTFTKKNYEISAPASHTAHVLFSHFEIIQKPNGKILPTEKNVAILVDVCTQIFRVQNALDEFIRTNPWLDKHELARNIDKLREGVRAVELVANRLPRFGVNELAPVERVEGIYQEVSKSMQEHVKMVSNELAKARTVDEEQAVLRRAGIVKNGH